MAARPQGVTITKKIGRKTGIVLAVVTIAFQFPALATEWGYEGEGAPDRWADLHPAFTMCRDGLQQSPVDLTRAVPIDDAGIVRRLGGPGVDRRT